MAKSSNRRKNGKVVKADIKKRVNNALKYELKDLRIVSVVDREEVEGRSRPLPRTYVWDVRKNKEVSLSLNQRYAIHSLRWKWDVYTGIVCRDITTGEITFAKEDGFVCNEEYFQNELSSHLADKLCDDFIACEGNSLTMVWVMCPVLMETELDVKILLYGLWKWNILGSHLTEKENADTGRVIRFYRAETFDDFLEWWNNQSHYLDLARQNKIITFRFVGTGTKPLPKELVAYRNELKLILEKDLIVFNPRATVKGFVEGGAMENIKVSGEVCSLLMTSFDKIPSCLDVYVDVKYENGDVNKIKFCGGNREKQD